MSNRSTRAARDRRRRGAIYLLVLAVAANVLVIGLAATYLVRVRLRAVVNNNEAREARLLAQSAVEQAVSAMNDAPTTWRQDFFSGVQTTPIAFGAGQMSFILTDDDGDLADDATDPLWIDGIGQVGGAVWVERARARIDGGLPLEFLRTALHCRTSLTGAFGTVLTVVGAPASADSDFAFNGSITGDAEAVSASGTGSVSGTLTTPVTKKGMPARTLLDHYVARATTLTYSGDLNKIVLGPGVNEYDGSGVNADGVYYLNTGGSNLAISIVRVCGTLIVDVGNGTLTIGTCLMQPYREDFPVLIVKGSVNAYMQTPQLAEGAPNSHNLNPSGAPYQGVSDSDTADTYPLGLFGLVHIIGELTVQDCGVSKGVFVVDGQVTVAGTASQITHDSGLMLNPPLGYTDDPNSTAMIIRGGSWSRQPAP